MVSQQSVRFGVAGLGGYAAYVTERLFDESAKQHPVSKLVAVCDPEPEQFHKRVQELARRDVRTLRSCEELFKLDIDAVWLPVPIDLHRPFTEMALAAGKAVLCEKPATACVDDVDAMIAARDRAGLPVLVGFQDLYQPNVELLKQRLLAGEFGRPIAATVIGCWPRGDAYFRRNDWAGRLQRNGRWVMDSPAANALAHFLHLSLYLLGSSFEQAATPLAVAAELYRANAIENYDTCSLRFTLPGKVPLFVAYTHACSETVEPMVTLETEGATIHYQAYRYIEIRMKDGTRQRLLLSDKPHTHMLATFHRCLRDPSAGKLGATLEMSRAHVVAVNVASEAAPVIDVPAEHVQPIHDSEDNVVRSIDGIVAALKASVEQKCMLHETGLLPWATRAYCKEVGQYAHFRGPYSPRPPAGRAAALVEPAVALQTKLPLRRAGAVNS